MTDRETLLAAVLNDPADDTARLVLADILRESDEPAERAEGAFLWAGVTASRFRDERVIDDPLFYAAQQEISRVMATGLPARWVADLGLGPDPLARGDWVWDCTGDRVTVRIGSAAGVFARGMLSGLVVALPEWCAAAPVALARWPLEGGTITDVPGLTFAIGPAESGWQLVARLRVRGRRVPMTAAGVVPTAVMPQAFLVEQPGTVEVEELFPDRDAVARGLAAASTDLLSALREDVGDRWPTPPRPRPRR